MVTSTYPTKVRNVVGVIPLIDRGAVIHKYLPEDRYKEGSRAARERKGFAAEASAACPAVVAGTLQHM